MDGGRCVAAPAASAPASFFPADSDFTPQPVPGKEAHDGFMLRLTLGIGGAAAGYEVQGIDVGYSGAGTTFSVDAGATIATDLVLHGRLAFFTLTRPSVTIDDTRLDDRLDGTLTGFMIGPAISYYFMPINLYLTGAIGLAGVSLRDETEGRVNGSTDAGWALNLDLGKEWWVDDQWGLGVAARLWLSEVPDETAALIPVDLGFFAVGVLFSATYQ